MRAVRLVGDDDVEGLDRQRRVVVDGLRFLEQALDALGGLLVGFFRQLAALEHRIHALDGADADARRPVELVAGEVLDDELLAELVVVDGRDVLVELLLGLPAEVAAVHQEQDTPRAGELDQPVDEADGGEGLAGACRHLDQRARLVLREAGFQVADCGDLRGPELAVGPLGDQRRHRAHAREEGQGVGQRRVVCSAWRPRHPALAGRKVR
jgi:hypothetical protein